MGFAALVEEYLVHAHLGDDGLGRDGDGVGDVVHPDLYAYEASGQQPAPRIGVVRTHREVVGIGVDLRLGGIYLGVERLVVPLDREREARPGFYLAGVALRDGEVDLQRLDFGQLGHHDARRGIGAFADVAQADHAVERGVQLRERDVRTHDVDIGVEHRQFGACLFVGFQADGVLFEQGTLAVNTVFGQFELRFVARQLCQQRFVVDFGQQFALADG